MPENLSWRTFADAVTAFLDFFRSLFVDLGLGEWPLFKA